MGNLTDIARRHLRDRWRDALFIGAAVLLTAISIGSVTSKAAGKGGDAVSASTTTFGKDAAHAWSITVVQSHLEIGE